MKYGMIPPDVSRFPSSNSAALELGDEQLVGLAFEAVEAFVPFDEGRNAFYALLGEILERWAPEAEWEHNVAESKRLGFENELDADREAREERREFRAATRRVGAAS